MNKRSGLLLAAALMAGSVVVAGCSTEGAENANATPETVQVASSESTDTANAAADGFTQDARWGAFRRGERAGLRRGERDGFRRGRDWGFRHDRRPWWRRFW